MCRRVETPMMFFFTLNVRINRCFEARVHPTTLSLEPATLYRPQRSCGQGNIFTPVIHSVHRGSLRVKIDDMNVSSSECHFESCHHAIPSAHV